MLGNAAFAAATALSVSFSLASCTSATTSRVVGEYKGNFFPSEDSTNSPLMNNLVSIFSGFPVMSNTYTMCERLGILKSMDDIGWTQKARPEVINQLRESGVLDEGSDYGTSMQDFTNFLTGAETSVDTYDMILQGHQHEGTTLGYQSLALADMDFGDTAASEELLQQISNLTRMPQFVTP